MDFREFKTGDDFLQYIEMYLKKGATLVLDGGSADYCEIDYNHRFNIFVITYYEYSMSYMSQYSLHSTLIEALVKFSTSHTHYRYNKIELDFKWEIYK